MKPLMWAGFILNAVGATIWLTLLLFGWPFTIPETFLMGCCVFFTWYCGRYLWLE